MKWKKWKQQSWNEQLDVELLNTGYVTIDGMNVNTPREMALGNIIMRLNAQIEELRKPLHKQHGVSFS